jgi:transposase-like protein
MTVISGAERRRRWSDEDRARILAATFEPGAVIAEVARREDVCTSLVFKWRLLAINSKTLSRGQLFDLATQRIKQTVFAL